MPLVGAVTDELLSKLSEQNPESLSAARSLAEGDGYKNLGISTDGTWLLGEFNGLGPVPYTLSADFLHPDLPILRSNSPSPMQPDPFSLGLLVRYQKSPDLFQAATPHPSLVAKREKIVAAEERKKGKFTKKGPGNEEDKLPILRVDAMDAAMTLVGQLVAKGAWFSEDRSEVFEKIVKQLNEAKLPALAASLKRFAMLGKEKGLKDADRLANAGKALGQFSAVLGKTRQLLSHDFSQASDDDMIAEEYLDLDWSIEDLKKRGYGRENLSLLELAYERLDDEGRMLRLEVSNLIDLESGEMYQAVAHRPFKGLTPIAEQPSYQTPIFVPEAVIYPGNLNRRIRFEKNSEQANELTTSALEAAYGHAIPEFDPVLEEYRAMLQDPFGPREVVLFVQCAAIGKIGDTFVAEDANGMHLPLADRRKDYSHLFNLQRAAAALKGESPALLARLNYSTSEHRMVAIPLALLTPREHIRIGV